MIKSITSLRDSGSIIIVSYVNGEGHKHEISKNKCKWYRIPLTLANIIQVPEIDKELITKIKQQLKAYQKEQNILIDKALEA